MKNFILAMFGLFSCIAIIIVGFISYHNYQYDGKEMDNLLLVNNEEAELSDIKKEYSEVIEFTGYYNEFNKVNYFSNVKNKELYASYKYKDSFVKNNFSEYFKFEALNKKEVKLTNVLKSPTSGALIIPSYTYINNKKYKVVEIGAKAINEEKVLLPKSIIKLDDDFLKEEVAFVTFYGGKNLVDVGSVNCRISMSFNKKIKRIHLKNILCNDKELYVNKNTNLIYDEEILDDINWLSLKINKNNPYVMAKDGMIYSKSGDTLIYLNPTQNKRDYVVPNSVKKISNVVFKRRIVNNLTINANIDIIDDMFFNFYANKVIFNGHINKIASNALNKEKIIVKSLSFSSVGIIDDNAIETSLATLIINKVQEIDSEAIWFKGYPHSDSGYDTESKRYVVLPSNAYIDFNYLNHNVIPNTSDDNPVYICINGTKEEMDDLYKNLEADYQEYILFYSTTKENNSWGYNNDGLPRIWYELD